jgi:DNA-directed RNA polymerase subunit K/omega
MAEVQDAEKQNVVEGDGRYITVNIVARRARDINKTRAANMYDDNAPDPTDTAMLEYRSGLLRWEFRHHLTGQGEDFRSN